MEKRRRRHPQVTFTAMLKDILINIAEFIKKKKAELAGVAKKNVFNVFQGRGNEASEAEFRPDLRNCF